MIKKNRNLATVQRSVLLQRLVEMKKCLLHTELAFEATSKLVDMSEVAKEEARSDTTQFARMVVEKAAPKMRLDLGRSSSKIQVVKRLRVTLLNKNPLEIGDFVDSKVNKRLQKPITYCKKHLFTFSAQTSLLCFFLRFSILVVLFF